MPKHGSAMYRKVPTLAQHRLEAAKYSVFWADRRLTSREREQQKPQGGCFQWGSPKAAWACDCPRLNHRNTVSGSLAGPDTLTAMAVLTISLGPQTLTTLAGPDTITTLDVVSLAGPDTVTTLAVVSLAGPDTITTQTVVALVGPETL